MKGLYDDAVPHSEVSATPCGIARRTDARGTDARGTDGRAQNPPDVLAPARFERHDVDGCAVVGATGEIDVATAPAFRAALAGAVDRSPRLVVDLSCVTFLDCAGLSALATVVRRVRANGEVPHLVGVTGIVDRVITLTRLDDVVAVDASVEDALASMAPAPS
jgi:anti-sigma B factor antagonist